MLHGLTRLNKFLIRNTGLLSVQEMANFLGTTSTQIQRRMVRPWPGWVVQRIHVSFSWRT
ncbi:MAG: hypothetical protein WC975_14015 [Phycisphaerae bacterium]